MGINIVSSLGLFYPGCGKHSCAQILVHTISISICYISNNELAGQKVSVCSALGITTKQISKLFYQFTFPPRMHRSSRFFWYWQFVHCSHYGVYSISRCFFNFHFVKCLLKSFGHFSVRLLLFFFFYVGI